MKKSVSLGNDLVMVLIALIFIIFPVTSKQKYKKSIEL